jgi:hypothetical protein
MTPDPDPPADGESPSTKAEAPAEAGERRATGDRRAGEDRRKKSVPVAVERRSGIDRRSGVDRRDAGKRGGEYDLDAETMEFIGAVNAYKSRTGKPFPTWSEILGILRSLGWEKRA